MEFDAAGPRFVVERVDADGAGDDDGAPDTDLSVCPTDPPTLPVWAMTGMLAAIARIANTKDNGRRRDVTVISKFPVNDEFGSDPIANKCTGEIHQRKYLLFAHVE
jgi:hypothetical protein